MLRKKEKELKLERKEDKKIIVLILFLLVLLSFSITNISYSQEVLTSIEEKVFHHKYTNETNEQRMSRLEEFIFGKKYQNETTEVRLNRISNALQPQKGEKKHLENTITPQESQITKTDTIEKEPKVIYDESFNTGILGAISQIEFKIFNKTFNNVPFGARVSALENQLLTKFEIPQARKKPLLERVTILLNRAGLITNRPIQAPNINNPIPATKEELQPKSYTLDARTNFLINEETGEIIKDNFGRPIRVKLPPELQGQNQINQFNPSLQQNPSQQGIPTQVPPLDFLFKNGEFGGEQEY